MHLLRHLGKRAPLLALEPMEPRRLLSAILIQGTSGDDRIIISYGSNAGEVIIVTAPGFRAGTVITGKRMFDIDGGAGNDYIEVRQGGYPADHRREGGNWVALHGGSGDDTLVGGDNGTSFDGGPGNDQLIGRQPDGWQWMDDLIFPGASAGVVVRMDLGEVEEDGFGGHDVVTNIGDVDGTDFGDIIYAPAYQGTMSGLGGNDLLVASANWSSHLSGGDGNDTLEGGAQGDELVPGPGDDFVDGGGGTDNLNYYASDGIKHGAIVRLDRNLVEDDGSGGVDRLASIENVSVQSEFADVIYGNALDNNLFGDGGADFVFGGGGNDTLEGGQCATILGGSGDDHVISDYRYNIIDGGSGADTIELIARGWSDSVDQIVPDSNDTVIDNRSSGLTPAEMIRPVCDPRPYQTPSESDQTQEPPVNPGPCIDPPRVRQNSPAATLEKKHKKHKRHHKHDIPSVVFQPLLNRRA